MDQAKLRKMALLWVAVGVAGIAFCIGVSIAHFGFGVAFYSAAGVVGDREFLLYVGGFGLLCVVLGVRGVLILRKGRP